MTDDERDDIKRLFLSCVSEIRDHFDAIMAGLRTQLDAIVEAQEARRPTTSTHTGPCDPSGMARLSCNDPAGGSA